ncbi:MAG: methyl-accepting chemotaxis protein [Selenomonadaceae bacterium]|nr:methyl-accepting chemotaxis protein [Selenomonadaceae bacterium]
MGIFKNMKIGAKLIALVIFMELIILSTAFHGVSRQHDVSDVYQDIYNKNFQVNIDDLIIGIDGFKLRHYLSKSLTAVNPADRDDAYKKMQAAFEEMESNLADITSKAELPEVKENAAKMKTKIEEVKKNANAAYQFRTSMEQNGIVGNNALNAFEKSADELDAQVYAMSKLSRKVSSDAMVAVDEDVHNEIYTNVIISAIMIIVTLGVGYSVSSSISKRIVELSKAAEVIASGDLTKPIKNNSSDEVGVAAANFEIMRQRMHESIVDIGTAADQVAAGSKNVSEASVNLSQGAAEQASSVEQLSASISEIASQTASNASNADRANELTVLAQTHADVGNTEMKNMLAAMEEINDSSANISKIIKVIDEIAFQTNILALNAAVEAARAGQHGKGFAVVAEEVRNLAARSAKAAKETTDLIEGSIDKVNGGREIANKTAEALNTIVGNVAEVADIVSAIAKASNEQKIALEQINQGVLQVSQVVQANSATSEEAASASEELNAQAERMKETASRFKVNGGISRVSPSSSNFTSEPIKKPDTFVAPVHSTGMSGAIPAKPKKAAPGAKPNKIVLTDEEDFGKY